MDCVLEPAIKLIFNNIFCAFYGCVALNYCGFSMSASETCSHYAFTYWIPVYYRLWSTSPPARPLFLPEVINFMHNSVHYRFCLDSVSLTTIMFSFLRLIVHIVKYAHISRTDSGYLRDIAEKAEFLPASPWVCLVS